MPRLRRPSTGNPCEIGMDQIIIYHNPACSKSREALNLLKEGGVEPDVIPYLETPPGHRTIGRILDLLGMEPRDLMRKKEEAYRSLEVEGKQRSREELIQLMVENPILIERPIVVHGDRAAIGRPPENVLKVL